MYRPRGRPWYTGVVKQHAPAAERNREPILAVLRRVLPAAGRVVEIASGTGQHAVHFAAGLPNVRWQPTDVHDGALARLAAWRDCVGRDNLAEPLVVDVCDAWDEIAAEAIDALVCINMIHITPWACSEALFRGAGEHLAAGGKLVTYGPYRFSGAFTAPSNRDFDASLRMRDPSWGVRDVDDLEILATAAGLEKIETVEMPANNHVLVFRKT